MSSQTETLVLDDTDIPLTFTDEGQGPVVLLLHGGGGPATVEAFGTQYAEHRSARVVTPVHPGFQGTPRPDALASIAGLARLYVALLEQLDVTDVTVVGNSIGGWITAELALLGSDRVARYVLVDGVGLEIDDAPIADFFALTMDQVTDLSYYRPDAFRRDLSTLPEAAQQIMAGNRDALRVYGGATMADPGLLARLPGAAGPTLVVWGAADRIVPPAHGLAYATGLPAARLTVIEDAGHLPQLETPDTLERLVGEFVDAG